MPTESWSLHELKLTFDKNFPPKNSTFLLLTYDIPNIKSKTDNITSEDLTTDEELEIKKTYFPKVERTNLLISSTNTVKFEVKKYRFNNVLNVR